MAAGVQVIVRLNLGLKALIDEAAARNQTSMSAEVQARLKRTFIEDEQRGEKAVPDVERIYARLYEALRHGAEVGADARGVAREKWHTDPDARKVARAELLREWEAIEALLAGQVK